MISHSICLASGFAPIEYRRPLWLLLLTYPTIGPKELTQRGHDVHHFRQIISIQLKIDQPCSMVEVASFVVTMYKIPRGSWWKWQRGPRTRDTKTRVVCWLTYLSTYLPLTRGASYAKREFHSSASSLATLSISSWLGKVTSPFNVMANNRACFIESSQVDQSSRTIQWSSDSEI